MKRIIINHWTAGLVEEPSFLELQHYHFLIDGKGEAHKGKYPISANDDCKDGEYAAHTGGGNTNAIGIAVCGMAGFVYPKTVLKKYALTKVQVEALFELNAKLLLAEGWNVAATNNLLTHYEFGKINPKTSSAGKIDITYLPPYPDIHPNMVGEFIRAKTNYYMQKINK